MGKKEKKTWKLKDVTILLYMSLNKFEYDDNIILLSFRGKSEWKTVTDSTKPVAG